MANRVRFLLKARFSKSRNHGWLRYFYFLDLYNIPLLMARKMWLSLSSNQKTEEVIQQGFRPPRRMMNESFVNLMHLEMMMMKRPPVGSSILMVGEKLEIEK